MMDDFGSQVLERQRALWKQMYALMYLSINWESKYLDNNDFPHNSKNHRKIAVSEKRGIFA